MAQLTKMDRQLGLSIKDYENGLEIIENELGKQHSDVVRYRTILEVKKHKTINEIPIPSSDHKFMRIWALEYRKRTGNGLFE